MSANKNKSLEDKMPVELSREQRESMAKTHENFAACLRSDKSISDCHSEMKKSCQESMGKMDCPMMGKGMVHSLEQKE